MLRLVCALYLLGLFSSHALAASFSIKCEYAGYHFFTFDEQTRRVLHEDASLNGELRTYRGKIKKADEDEILFEILSGGQHPVDVAYQRKQGRMHPVAPQPGVIFVNCVPSPLRAVLSKYETWPFD